MKFIYADSLDFVDPGFDFAADSYSEGRQVYWDDKFAHEMLMPEPYDGILVSRATVGGKRGAGKYTESQRMRLSRVGARKFLRYNEQCDGSKWLFGDCGAFSYHKEETPPYTPEDTLEFYSDCCFTHGCSVDHVIFECIDNQNDMGGGSSMAEDRFEITLANAEKFLAGSRALGPSFTPVGVIQGWSPFSMAESADSLVKMGYKFIAVGGMVPLKIPMIHSCLRSIRDRIGPRNDIAIHLLGFAKADRLDEFVDYGITSFDSSSPMIRAFKDDKHNYYALGPDNSFVFYSAIRIPQSTKNVRLNHHVKSGRYRQEDLVAMEDRALSAIRNYAVGRADLEDALDAILAYSVPLIETDRTTEAQLERKLSQKRVAYSRTLMDRPWEDCTCEICRQAGVEAVIFRASNRNKRRGMHNLAVFYRYIRNLNPTI